MKWSVGCAIVVDCYMNSPNEGISAPRVIAQGKQLIDVVQSIIGERDPTSVKGDEVLDGIREKTGIKITHAVAEFQDKTADAILESLRGQIASANAEILARIAESAPKNGYVKKQKTASPTYKYMRKTFSQKAARFLRLFAKNVSRFWYWKK